MDLADRNAMSVKYDGGGRVPPPDDGGMAVGELVRMISGLAARYN